MFDQSAAVLQLLRTSAARFAEILDLTDDVRTANAMTGFRADPPPETGGETDVYA